MAQPFSLESLQVQLASDTEIYISEKLRCNRLFSQSPPKVVESDRRSIINWSRASISEYSTELERMEEIESPSKEDKQKMGLLNQLVLLGDQINEFTTGWAREWEERYGKVDWTPEAKADGRARRKSAVPPPLDSAPPVLRAGGISHLPTEQVAGPHEPRTLHAATEASVTPSTPTATELARNKRPENIEAADDVLVLDNDDPKGVYALLGVTPDASMVDIRKAYRTKIKELHPDKNPSVGDAAGQFVEFKALCSETIDNEEMRRMYGGIRTIRQLKELDKRARGLTMGGATYT